MGIRGRTSRVVFPDQRVSAGLPPHPHHRTPDPGPAGHWLSVMVGTGKGARPGILIRSAEALEPAHKLDTIVPGGRRDGATDSDLSRFFSALLKGGLLPHGSLEKEPQRVPARSPPRVISR